MSTISITQFYDMLSTKLGKETAENLTTFIDNKINQGLESQSNILATKEDLAKLSLATKEDLAKIKDDIAKLTLSTKEDISNLAASTKADISNLAASTKADIARLDTKISDSKSETIKWMFIFWVGQMILLYFRK
jgi:hypothetical protein